MNAEAFSTGYTYGNNPPFYNTLHSRPIDSTLKTVQSLGILFRNKKTFTQLLQIHHLIISSLVACLLFFLIKSCQRHMRSTGSHVAVKEAKIGAMTSIRPFKMEFRTFEKNGAFFHAFFVAMIW